MAANISPLTLIIIIAPRFLHQILFSLSDIIESRVIF